MASAAASADGVISAGRLALEREAVVTGVVALATVFAWATAVVCGLAAFRVFEGTPGGVFAGARGEAGLGSTLAGVAAALGGRSTSGGSSRSPTSRPAGPGLASATGAAYVTVCMTKVASTTFAIHRLFFSIRPYPASVVRPQGSVAS